MSNREMKIYTSHRSFSHGLAVYNFTLLMYHLLDHSQPTQQLL